MSVASETAVLRAERRSLYTYMFTMLGLAVLGFAVYAITRVSATQLDGVISLINAAAAFIAARLAVTSTQPADVESPYGRMALENFYALFRSLMILGVVIVGLITNLVKVGDYLITREGSQYISREFNRFYGGTETGSDWTIGSSPRARGTLLLQAIERSRVSRCRRTHRCSWPVPQALSSGADAGRNETKRKPSRSTGTRRLVPKVSNSKPASLAAAQATTALPSPIAPAISATIRSRTRRP